MAAEIHAADVAEEILIDTQHPFPPGPNGQRGSAALLPTPSGEQSSEVAFRHHPVRQNAPIEGRFERLRSHHTLM
jgi:hypothetical protein